MCFQYLLLVPLLISTHTHIHISMLGIIFSQWQDQFSKMFVFTCLYGIWESIGFVSENQNFCFCKLIEWFIAEKSCWDRKNFRSSRVVAFGPHSRYRCARLTQTKVFTRLTSASKFLYCILLSNIALYKKHIYALANNDQMERNDKAGKNEKLNGLVRRANSFLKFPTKKCVLNKFEQFSKF
jgi:hypothetical protein